eukprot:scaffold25111_cov80-Cyclotella_meneghiniana.AAC.13
MMNKALTEPRKRNRRSQGRFETACLEFPEFTLPNLQGKPPSLDQIKSAKDAAIRCIKTAVGGRKEHALLEATFIEGIENMTNGKELNIFTGKCPVPDKRGGANISSDNDNVQKENPSILAMRYYTHDMPKDTVLKANCRDICKQTGELNIRFGYCDDNTDDECFVMAYNMNVMGKLATFLGAPLRAINVGGSSLKPVYDNIVDEYFVDVVAEGVHMSACVSLRSTSFRK